MKKCALLVFLILHSQVLLGDSVPVPKVILPTIFDGGEIHCDNVKVDVYAHTTPKEYRYKKENFLVPGPMDSQFKVGLSYSNKNKKIVSKIIGIPFDKETLAFENTGSVWAISQLEIEIWVNGKKLSPELKKDTHFSRIWAVWRQDFPANGKVEVSYHYKFFGWGGDDCPPKENNLYYLGFLLSPAKNHFKISSDTQVTIHFTDELNKRYFFGIPEPSFASEKKVSWSFKKGKIPDCLTFAYSDGDKTALKAFLLKYEKGSLQKEAGEIESTSLLYFDSVTVSEDELRKMIDNPEVLDVLDKATRDQSDFSPEEFESFFFFYYQHPVLDQVNKAISYLSNSKLLETKEAVKPLFLGFFSEIFHSQKNVTPNWEGLIAQQSETTRALLKKALEISNDPKRAMKMLQMNSESNDFCWGGFFASGDEYYVKELIERLKYYKERKNLNLFQTGFSAKWSLACNLRKHSKVKEILQKSLSNSDIAIRSEIVEIQNLSPEVISEHAVEIVKALKEKGNL